MRACVRAFAPASVGAGLGRVAALPVDQHVRVITASHGPGVGGDHSIHVSGLRGRGSLVASSWMWGVFGVEAEEARPRNGPWRRG